ncbi:short subunit dehydrogenase [Novosphingobium taihuense]|nr:short subunit dehydrogenase [Novosphingobium taihuense]
MRDTTRKVDLLEAARSAGLEIEIRALDVADASSIDVCIAEVIAAHGGVDLLINNAGAGLVASIEQTSDDALRRIMEVNFFGVWNTVKAVIPHMRAAGSGRVITVTSIGGLVGQPFNDAYCASKFAVEGFMESFAPLALTMGIRLSVVAPGPVNSAFVANVRSTSRDAAAAMAPPYDRMLDRYNELSNQTFAGMGQTPDEIAQIIVDLSCADDPAFRVLTAPMVGATVSAKASDPTGSGLIRSFAQVLGA